MLLLLVSACVSLVIPVNVTSVPAMDETLQYTNFQLNFNCKKKRADRWTYTLTPQLDGNSKRPGGFYLDPNYSTECQQRSTTSYGSGYDRGHLVTSSHMDMTADDRHQSHFMTNILPQISTFNQGIWLLTEEITSCIRTFQPITVYGGVIFNDESNDYFLLSHGVATPDLWWKVLVTKDAKGNTDIISWMFPNQENLGTLDDYLVSVNDIEKQLQDGLGAIPVPAALKELKATTSWSSTDCM
jgi:endonuclease G